MYYYQVTFILGIQNSISATHHIKRIRKTTTTIRSSQHKYQKIKWIYDWIN